MKPMGHAIVGISFAYGVHQFGYRVNPFGCVLGSVLPDIDIVLFAPFLGRMRGHRTITHAPAFQLLLAWSLRRYGFWSVFLGQILHSLADNAGGGKPAGVAWAFPFSLKRMQIGQRFVDHMQSLASEVAVGVRRQILW